MLSRPDFDPGEAPAAGPAEGSRPLTVSELNRGVRGMLERGYPLIAVRGEVSNFTRATSGHLYFVLKDAGAQVRCAMWRGRAQGLAFTPANGDAVELRAIVTLFEARGEFQLNVETMRRDGAGTLYDAFLRLKEKLAAEGLFDAGRKRALPAFPRCVGVVTSLKAAALRDVLTALRRRAPMIPVVVYPTPVQGEAAAPQIARAIAAANAHGAADVLIVCRGGGGIEDLWAYNEESVARAIAGSAIPVVSGVGHETDFTIADFVADLRAPTPTAAAELVSPLAHRSADFQLAALADQLTAGIETRLAEARQRLDWLARELVPPSARLEARRRRLADLGRRLVRQMVHVGERRRDAYATLRGRLRALRWRHPRRLADEPRGSGALDAPGPARARRAIGAPLRRAGPSQPGRRAGARLQRGARRRRQNPARQRRSRGRRRARHHLQPGRRRGRSGKTLRLTGLRQHASWPRMRGSASRRLARMLRKIGV